MSLRVEREWIGGKRRGREERELKEEEEVVGKGGVRKGREERKEERKGGGERE